MSINLQIRTRIEYFKVSLITKEKQTVEAIESIITDLLKKLPSEELENLLEKTIDYRMSQGITRIKIFLKQYNKDNPVDYLLGHLIHDVINTIGVALEKDIEKSKGNTYCSHDAAKVAAVKLREIAKRIESEVVEHQRDCDHHD